MKKVIIANLDCTFLYSTKCTFLSYHLHLSFAGSLRLGELLGLTWDCVDVTQESIDRGMASIFITKELQRTSKSTLSQLDDKDILVKFPEQGTRNKTVLVLKKPKTATSVRKIFLPPIVAQMLVGWKEDQDLNREMLGDDNDGSTAPENESADTAAAAGLDAETLTKILNNPELATLLKTLADKL